MARVATRSRTTTASAAAASPQKALHSFARSSKAAISSSPLKKSVAAAPAAPIIRVAAPTSAPVAPNPRKRKASDDEPAVEPAVELPASITTEPVEAPATPTKPVKRVRIKADASPAVTAPLFATPHKPKTPSKLSTSTATTPTSATKRSATTPRSGRLDSGKISKRSKKFVAPANNTRISDFFLAVRRKTRSGLPVVFDDLLSLHMAFMRTVVVQIAHNGTSEFLKLSDVLPQVSRNWGKRQAGIEDMRRIVAIQNYNGGESPFEITSLGPVMCLRLTTDRALDVSAINAAFEESLRLLCTEAATSRAGPVASQDPESLMLSMDALSVSDLPRAEITKEELPAASSASAVSALHNAVAAPMPSAIPTHDSVTGAPLTVLQRIRLKEAAAKKTLVTSVSAQKKAMLQRAQKVAGTISALINPEGMVRQSFAIEALTERIQDSFGGPVEAAVVKECVQIVAKEIAPEWVTMRVFRGREFVIVQRDMFPGESVVHQRVTKLST